jgi:hypothetical protein
MATQNSGATRRLIALIAGIGFFISGIVLMWMGISATGSLDIQSVLISGKIQTGSAGLIIIFLATFIIIFATVGSDRFVRVDGEIDAKAEAKNVFYISPISLRFFWVLCALLLVMLTVALLIPTVATAEPIKLALSAIAFVAGMGAFFTFLGLLFTLLLDFD